MKPTADSYQGISCGCTSDSGGGSSSCSTEGAGFSRPNFFAGQLLTDEDLRDAMGYIVEKNRLHNRHLYGEGVVCGLQVTPHPCPEDRHKVIVHKGNAINGCGDDILVSRKHEIDVVAKARELLAEKRGDYACGDPCRDHQLGEKELAGVRQQISDVEQELADQPTPFGERPDQLRQKLKSLKELRKQLAVRATGVQYGLYVRYQEFLSDPVTAYAVDDLNNPGCQHTRIREGYSFELRCNEERRYPSLKSRLEVCNSLMRNYGTLQARAMLAISTLEMVDKVKTQFNVLKKPSEIPGDDHKPFENFEIDENGKNTQLEFFKNITFLPDDLSGADNTVLQGLTLSSIRNIFDSVSATYFSNVKSFIGDLGGNVDDDSNTPLEGFDGPSMRSFRDIEFLPCELVRQTDEDLKAKTLKQLKKSIEQEVIDFKSSIVKFSLHLDLLYELFQSAKQVKEAFATIGGTNLGIKAQRSATKAAHRFLTLAYRVLYVVDHPPKALMCEIQRLLATSNTNGETRLSLLKLVDRTASDAVPVQIIDTLIDRNRLLEEALLSGEKATTFDGQSRVVGELLDLETVTRVLSQLDEVKITLRAAVAGSEIALAPSLVSELLGVHLDGIDDDRFLLGEKEFGQVKDGVSVVNRAVTEVSRLCTCDALLPPCPADDDSGVLLAVLTVNDCEVTEIRNLSRRMVVSGPALRYWFDDFSSFLSGPRGSCSPSAESIEKAIKREADRQKARKQAWMEEASVSSPAKDQFVPFLVGDNDSQNDDGSPDDRVELLRLWTKVFGLSGDSPVPEQTDGVPPLLPGGSQQKLEQFNASSVPPLVNSVLAQLAGRPETDLRNVLSWSKEFGAPAEIREIAQENKLIYDELGANFERLKTSVKEELTIDDDGTDKPVKQFVKEQVTIDDDGTDKPVKQFVTEQVTVDDNGTDKPVKQFVTEQVTVDDNGTDKPVKQFVTEQVTIDDNGTDKPVKQFVTEQVTIDDDGTDKPVKQFVREQVTVDDNGTEKPVKQYVTEQVKVDVNGSEMALKQFVIDRMSFELEGTEKEVAVFVDELANALRRAIEGGALNSFANLRDAVKPPLDLP